MSAPHATVAVLTRDGSRYGLRVLNALTRVGLTADAVVVADESIARRWRLLRSVARRLGWFEAIGAAAERVAADRHHAGGDWRGAPLVTDYSCLAGTVVRVDAFNSPDGVAALAGLRADWMMLGQTGILRAPALATARCGVLNAHPGWLPDYRGIQPAVWALSDDHAELLGSTLHLVDAGLDTGAIVARRPLHRSAWPRFEQLDARLYEDCIDLLVETARAIRDGGAVTGVPQPAAAGATYSVAPRRVRRAARAAYERLRAT